jgi:putative FmdB family regulatory protein
MSMPLYEYACRRHGEFELSRKMSESRLPVPCPSCRQPSVRILSAPNVAQVGMGERIGRDRNEQSRHEPAIFHTRDAPTKKKPPERRGLVSASSCGRPWAIGH